MPNETAKAFLDEAIKDLERLMGRATMIGGDLALLAYLLDMALVEGAERARPMTEEQPSLNTGQPRSDLNNRDLKWNVKHRITVERIAEFLCRTEKEIRDQARKLRLGTLPTFKGARKRKLIPARASLGPQLAR